MSKNFGEIGFDKLIKDVETSLGQGKSDLDKAVEKSLNGTSSIIADKIKKVVIDTNKKIKDNKVLIKLENGFEFLFDETDFRAQINKLEEMEKEVNKRLNSFKNVLSKKSITTRTLTKGIELNDDDQKSISSIVRASGKKGTTSESKEELEKDLIEREKLLKKMALLENESKSFKPAQTETDAKTQLKNLKEQYEVKKNIFKLDEKIKPFVRQEDLRINKPRVDLARNKFEDATKNIPLSVHNSFQEDLKKVETAKNNAIEIKKKEALSGSKQSEIPVDNYAEARKEFEAAVKASNEAVKAAEKVGNATSDVTNKVKNEISEIEKYFKSFDLNSYEDKLFDISNKINDNNLNISDLSNQEKKDFVANYGVLQRKVDEDPEKYSDLQKMTLEDPGISDLYDNLLDNDGKLSKLSDDIMDYEGQIGKALDITKDLDTVIDGLGNDENPKDIIDPKGVEKSAEEIAALKKQLEDLEKAKQNLNDPVVVPTPSTPDDYNLNPQNPDPIKDKKTQIDPVIDVGFDVSKESKDLSQLVEILQNVQTEIRAKNDLFSQEEYIVNKAVSNEVSDLSRLENKILDIQTTLSSLNLNSINSSKDDNSAYKEIELLDKSLKNLDVSLKGLDNSKLLSIEKTKLDTSVSKINVTSANVTNIQKMANSLLDLAAAIELLNKNQSAKEILSGLKISNSNIKNIEVMAAAIDVLKTSLNFSDVVKKSLNSLKELTSQGSALKDLNSILKVSDKKQTGVDEIVSKEKEIAKATKNTNTEEEKNIELLKKRKEELSSLASSGSNSGVKKYDSNIYSIKNPGVEKLDGYNQKVEELNLLYDKLKKHIANFDSLDDKAFADGKTKVQEYGSEISALINQLKNSRWNTDGLVKIVDTQISDNLDSGKDVLTKYVKDLNDVDMSSLNFSKSKDGLDQLTYKTKAQNGQVKTMVSTYDSVTKALKKYEKSEKSVLSGMNKFWTGLKSKWSDVAKYLLSFGSLYQVWAVLKSGIATIKDLDTAMVEVKKVTNESAKTYAEFADAAYSSANKIASTASALMTSSADFVRMGNNLQDAATLANNAAVYVNVGDGIDIATATSDMVSAMKAFNIQADDSVRIIDAYNQVGNNFAISSTDIGEAMKRSSSALASANNSFEESIALAAAMNETVQDADVVGNTLKVMSLRLRGSSANAVSDLEDMGEETDGVITSTSKLRDAIMSLTNVSGQGGFDIMADEDTFKSTYDMIKGIAQVYGQMSDVNQASLLEIMAGKTRANGVAALLSNYEKLDEVSQSALNSSGSAAKENENIINSISGKMTILQSRLQEFWAKAINTDVVKGSVDVLSDLLKMVTKLVDKFGILKIAIASALGGVLLKNNFSKIAAATGLTELGSKIKESWSIYSVVDTTNIDKLSKSVKGLTAAQGAQKLILQEVGATEAEAALIKAGFSEETSKEAVITAQTNVLKAQQIVLSETISASKLQELLATTALTEEEQVQIMTTLGLTEAQLAETGATDLVTKSKILEALATQGVSESNIAVMSSQLGVAASNGVAAGSFKALGLSILGTAKAVLLFLATNPLGWIAIATGAFVAVVTIVEKTKKAYIDAKKEIISTSDETIASTNSEISSLTALQSKLVEAKGNKEALNAISGELNSTIGLTKGLLDGESGAWTRQNALIEAQIAILKQKAKLAVSQKVEAEKDIFNEQGYGDDNKLSGGQIRQGLDALKIYQEKYIEKGMSEDDAYNKAFSDVSDNAAGYGNFLTGMTKADLQEYLKSQVTYAQDIFSDVVAQSDNGLLGKDFLNSFISDAVNDGSDLSVIQTELDSMINTSGGINDLINEYYDSLASDNGNSDELYGQIMDQLGAIKDAYPDMADTIDLIVDGIASGSNSIASSVDDVTSSLTTLGSSMSTAKSSIAGYNSLLSSLNSGGLNSSDIDKVLSDYPELIPYLDNEVVLREKIAEAVEKQKNAYTDCYEEALLTNEDFYANNIANNTQLATELNSLYGIDLSNYGTLADLKSAINSVLTGELSSTNATLMNDLATQYGYDGENFSQDCKDKIKMAGETAKSINQIMYKGNATTYEQLTSLRAHYLKFGQGSGSGTKKVTNPYASEIADLNSLISVYDNMKAASTSALNDIDGIVNSYAGKVVESTLNASDGSSSSDDTTEAFDWIDRAIQSVERRITNLGNIVSNVYKTWSNRNSALSSEISNISGEIGLQYSAYKEYMSLADSVGLSDYYKGLVQSGSVNVESISDSTLIDQIKAYQDYYDKALSAYDSMIDKETTLYDAEQERFDLIKSGYENAVSVIEHSATSINNLITLSESKGNLVSKKYYEELMSLEQETISILNNERNSLLNTMATSGIEQGTDAWFGMQSEILAVDEAIQSANNSLVEYSNNIRDLEKEFFNFVEGNVTKITDESKFLIDLLGKEDLYNDNGSFTDAGITTAALHNVNYETNLSQAQDYADEIAKLNEDITSDPYNTDLLDYRDELIQLQRDSISAAYDEKDAIKSLVEDSYNAQLDNLSKIIDKYKEEQQAIKDLYDYQKSIAEKTKNIASLEKQAEAYAGDTSEEAKSKVQQIKVSLENAKTDLADTEREQSLADQSKLLDEFYTEYEQVLNSRLDDVDAVVREVIAEISTSTGIIGDKLQTVTTENGITITSGLKDIIANSFGTGSTFMGIEASVDLAINKIKDLAAIMQSDLAILAEVQKKANRDAEEAARKAAEQAAAQLAAQKALLDQQAAAVQQSANVSSSSGSSSGSVSPWIQKNDYFDKNRLNVNTSIVDRLKYNNFDSSYAARKSYFSAFGGTGNYTGSASQNIWLLQKMRENGYAKGTKSVDKDKLAWTNENMSEMIVRKSDGAVLTPLRQGDKVFNGLATENMWNMANNPAQFIKDNISSSLMSGASNIVPIGQSSISNVLENLVVSLPGVTNYQEFRAALIQDSKFEAAVSTMFNNSIMGKNSLEKFKF